FLFDKRRRLAAISAYSEKARKTSILLSSFLHELVLIGSCVYWQTLTLSGIGGTGRSAYCATRRSRDRGAVATGLQQLSPQKHERCLRSQLFKRFAVAREK